MNRVYFEEVQYFREHRWLVALILALGLAALIPIAYGLYWQVLKGQPWGDEPLSNTGLTLLFLFVMFSFGMAMFMFLTMKLELRIDEDGIHYRFFPIKNKWHLIPKNQIAEYRVEKKLRLFQTGGFGHHRNLFTKTRSYRFIGTSHLFLVLHTGEKIFLGTEKPGEAEWALKKMLTVNPTS